MGRLANPARDVQTRTRVETGTGYELLGTALAAVLDAAGMLDGKGPPLELPDDADTAAAVAILVGLGREPLINLIGFLAGAGEAASAQALLAAIGSLAPADLRRVILGYHRRSIRRATDPEVMAAAIDGDGAAIERFLETSYPALDHWQASLRRFVGPGADEAAGELIAALSTLAAALGQDLPAMVDGVAEAADLARELVRTTPVDLAIERLAAGGGITFARAIGQEEVVINPRSSGPGIYVIVDYGQTLVVSYPAVPWADQSPPDRLIALGRALGDERRLRILRTLASSPMSIGDLASRLDMPRTSLQYHLSILRDAGLVGRAVDDAETGPIAIRRSALSQIGAELGRYLGLEGAERSSKPG